MSIRHVGIPVVDISASLGFYFKLGFNHLLSVALESGPIVSNLLGLEKVEVRTFKLVNDDGDVIELLDYTSPPKMETSGRFLLCREGLPHIAFTVNDLEKLYETLGPECFVYPPQISPDGRVKVAFCRDPDGAYLELVEPL